LGINHILGRINIEATSHQTKTHARDTKLEKEQRIKILLNNKKTAHLPKRTARKPLLTKV
jgi:hypothetical protein